MKDISFLLIAEIVFRFINTEIEKNKVGSKKLSTFSYVLIVLLWDLLLVLDSKNAL